LIRLIKVLLIVFVVTFSTNAFADIYTIQRPAGASITVEVTDNPEKVTLDNYTGAVWLKFTDKDLNDYNLNPDFIMGITKE